MSIPVVFWILCAAVLGVFSSFVNCVLSMAGLVGHRSVGDCAMAGFATWVTGLLGIAFLLRLPIYPFECAVQATVFGIERLTGVSTLRFSPVLAHELSTLPLPTLASHIRAHINRYGHTDLVLRAMHASQTALGQRRCRHKVSAPSIRAFVDVILRHADRGDYESMLELDDSILFGENEPSPFLRSFQTCARYLLAADHAQQPLHRIRFFEMAEAAVMNHDWKMLLQSVEDAHALYSVSLKWRVMIAERRKKAFVLAGTLMESPYRPGEALSPKRGREVFRGRDAIVTEIARIVSGQDSSGSVVLTAPRRYGKTSLLRMLPVLIPETLFVFFDLQDNPTDSSHGFFTALAKRTQKASEEWRQLKVPSLPDGSPFESARHWFELLETNSSGVSIVFCFDEFERLERLFPGDERELHKLMGLFRSITQYHHRVRLLISGAARFSELGRLWDDHFVNVQELTLERLDHDTTRQLLMCPVPTFPSGVIGTVIAN